MSLPGFSPPSLSDDEQEAKEQPFDSNEHTDAEDDASLPLEVATEEEEHQLQHMQKTWALIDERQQLSDDKIQKLELALQNEKIKFEELTALYTQKIEDITRKDEMIISLLSKVELYEQVIARMSFDAERLKKENQQLQKGQSTLESHSLYRRIQPFSKDLSSLSNGPFVEPKKNS